MARDLPPVDFAENASEASVAAPAEPPRSRARRKRHPFRVLLVVVAVFAVLWNAFAAWCDSGYRADDFAYITSALSPSGITDEGWTTFGDPTSTCGFVFYPGARVDAAAYARLMDDLADRGVFCVLVDMPHDMAFLNPAAAAGIQQQYPQVARWYLGGHSLGGVVAAGYLALGGASTWDGLVLLASYTPFDLTATDLDVLTVVGTCDGVINTEQLDKCAENLPQGAATVWIEGGNHAQFGSYGEQEGDGAALISSDEQRAQTVAAIASLMGLAGDDATQPNTADDDAAAPQGSSAGGALWGRLSSVAA